MSLFGNAAPIAAPKTGKASKPEKKQIPLEGLLAYANIDAAIKALEGIQASYEGSVKTLAFNSFCLMSSGSKPDSFTGVDGIATASVELRKRGTNSALKEDEVALLQKHGINPLKEVICQELFAINPKYAGDGALLGKVSDAISSVVPADFIVKQEEKSKLVVTDKNVEEVFAAKSRLAKDEFEALVKVVTTQALKAKLATTDIALVMAEVAKLLTADTSEVEEA